MSVVKILTSAKLLSQHDLDLRKTFSHECTEFWNSSHLLHLCDVDACYHVGVQSENSWRTRKGFPQLFWGSNLVNKVRCPIRSQHLTSLKLLMDFIHKFRRAGLRVGLITTWRRRIVYEILILWLENFFLSEAVYQCLWICSHRFHLRNQRK